MKKTIILFFISALSSIGYAQEANKQKELGITFNSLYSYGIAYKTGTATELWRFNTVYGALDRSTRTFDSLTQKNINNGIGLSIGREGRNKVANKVELRYGFDVNFRYSNYQQTSDYTNNSANSSRKLVQYTPGLGLIFGFNYLINENLILGAEILPTIGYNLSNETITNSNGTKNNFKTKGVTLSGINNNMALITLACRF